MSGALVEVVMNWFESHNKAKTRSVSVL